MRNFYDEPKKKEYNGFFLFDVISELLEIVMDLIFD